MVWERPEASSWLWASPQLSSDPSTCLFIEWQSSAFPCVGRIRAERGLWRDSTNGAHRVWAVVVVLWKDSALLLWHSGSRDQVRDYPKCSAQLARGGTCWKWSEYIFINCKGTLLMPSLSSPPGSCSASVQCRDTRASRQFNLYHKVLH